MKISQAKSNSALIEIRVLNAAKNYTDFQQDREQVPIDYLLVKKDYVFNWNHVNDSHADT